MAKCPELLAPAGDYEKLECAFQYGADAAYISGRNFGMRAHAGNFSDPEIRASASLAHDLNRKLYVTVNIAVRNHDLKEIKDYLRRLEDYGVDGIIVADPGILRLAQKMSIPIHISTQANTLNIEAVRFWAEQGATRVCLARELSAAEISEICSAAKIEIEVFIHGAMCISYSGRCLISKYMTNRDANIGDCAQSCRWRYFLTEVKDSGPAFPIDGDELGTYLYNSMDLCLARQIPKLITSGCRAFKIEGRMKSVNYVAAVTKVYRQIIDAYLSSPADFEFDDSWEEELNSISHRRYTEGFFSGDRLATLPEGGYKRRHNFVAVVRSSSPAGSMLEVRDKMSVDMHFTVVTPTGANTVFQVGSFFSAEQTEEMDCAHANDLIFIEVPNLSPGSIIRTPSKEKEPY